MKKAVCTLVLFWAFFALRVQAQVPEKYTCLDLSGFAVKIVRSGTFRFEEKNPALSEKRISGDTLSITIIDQTGQVPKGEITIYTNNIRYLSLHNSFALSSSDTINADSLDIVAACAFGELKITANYLSVNVGGGSDFVLSGSAYMFEGASGGASSLNASNFIAQKADVDARGYSNLWYNAKEILNEYNDKSQMRNCYPLQE